MALQEPLKEVFKQLSLPQERSISGLVLVREAPFSLRACLDQWLGILRTLGGLGSLGFLWSLGNLGSFLDFKKFRSLGSLGYSLGLRLTGALGLIIWVWLGLRVQEVQELQQLQQLQPALKSS